MGGTKTGMQPGQPSSDDLSLPPRLRQKLEHFRERLWSVKIAEGALAGLFGLGLSYLLVFSLDRLFDTRTMTDLTGPRLLAAARTEPVAAETPSASTVAFGSLPVADAITTVRGNGRRQLAVFSDPGCSFCRRLEPELDGLDDVTIHTFLLPFQGMARPVAIWCAADRVQAWRQAMQDGATPTAASASSCEHPIDRNLALARQLGVNGTPTLFWADGTRTEGFVTRPVIEDRLARTSPEAKP